MRLRTRYGVSIAQYELAANTKTLIILKMDPCAFMGCGPEPN